MSEETEKQTKEFWGLVEVLGHNRFAGLITEEVFAGASFVRVDVPSTQTQEAFSKLFGAGSIYSITPLAERTARAIASKLQLRPLQTWDLPMLEQQKPLPLPNDECF